MLKEINVADASNYGELSDEQLDAVTGGLVVISIIGITVGLLLPAINKVRE